ncbi:alpha/beta hydrolase [Winogradskyella aurantiaca]|uniref:alpha/beta hydrolase n=1 Tax=Winogradskyella aurantiaca TaxID=2219558 RepID=UPI000E1D2EA3|nr:alpha/beta hydrolase-fold protein [Winogradskyella aurantiaca]
MKRTISSLCLLFTISALIAQVSYKEITSVKLNTHRKLKIKLPKDYDPSSELKHPVIVVFDGDYLFEPVIGQVDFQTYFDDMPGSIVVGVVQGKERFYDGYVDDVSGLPTESGLRFHDFVKKELLPYLDANYKTSKFRVAVGHDLMGNYINSFLFQEEQAFQAYVVISPDYKGAIESQLPERLGYLQNQIFYYLATSDKDVRYIRNSVENTDEALSSLENQNLTYYFDNFKGETHYTLVTSAISRAFDKIFDIYKPLREKEIEEKVLPYDGTLDKYITDRYRRIEDLFGIEKPITEEELEKVVKVAEQREDLESLYKLGKLTQKLYPDSPQGTYYLAMHADRVGKKKKAAKLYEAALAMGDSPVIDKEFIMAMVEETNLATEDLETEEEDEDEEN